MIFFSSSSSVNNTEKPYTALCDNYPMAFTLTQLPCVRRMDYIQHLRVYKILEYINKDQVKVVLVLRELFRAFN